MNGGLTCGAESILPFLAVFPVTSSIFNGVIERPADRATIMGVAVHHHGQSKGAEPCNVFS
jgi:hypothetical protein